MQETKNHPLARAAVLIPSYKPDARLPELIAKLIGRGMDVLVVDDGGGEAYARFFSEVSSLGAEVVKHAVNLGKGRALKTGLNALMLRPVVPDVVTADADGQHTPEDIINVAKLLASRPNALALGVRGFTGDVPLKSRLGNGITRFVYSCMTGIRCRDTQTGLRGLPAAALPDMIRIPGERYEYEMNVLLQLREMNFSLAEVPIDTVYIDNNKGSHFNPLRDALRVMAVLARFGLSSLVSVFVDWCLFAALLGAACLPWLAYALARVVSASLNFTLNRKVVFRRGGKASLLKYALLACVQMVIGASLTHLLGESSAAGAFWIKLPVDTLLFFVSFYVQRRWVFTD